jgi:hypothetical protein
MNAIEVLESSDDQWYNGKGYTMHCVYMVLRLWKSNDNGFRCKASTVRDRRMLQKRDSLLESKIQVCRSQAA